jgi:serine/threonine protein kinase
MRINKGGKVLASGGFGCVFSPALKCEDTKPREKDGVSKLMTSEHAVEEYEEITSIKNKLDSIKNYEDYFLLKDITLCSPAKLTQTDLTAFDAKCSALKKTNITKKNINDNIQKLMTLNMPNGGIPVDDYINEAPDFRRFLPLHNHLVKLLKKGIVPMNEKHVYHCDIKDSNVLVKGDPTSLKTRLIDWGLSTEYNPVGTSPFPKTWRNRPLQFNVPFSVIIFSDSFVEKYTKYITDGGSTEEVQLKPFVVDYVISWMKERGAGHYKFINEIMFALNSHTIESVSEKDLPKVVETQFTMPYIVDYIVDVLVHFTRFKDDGRIDLREYLNTVFIKIVDIWGFISIYVPLVELLSNNYARLTENEMQVFQHLQFIFNEYLYGPRHEPIDLKTLYSDLKALGDTMNITLTGKKRTTSSSSKSKSTLKEVDLGSGVKTRKNRRGSKQKSNGKTLTVIRRDRRPRRFKNPIFLSVK